MKQTPIKDKSTKHNTNKHYYIPKATINNHTQQYIEGSNTFSTDIIHTNDNNNLQ